MFIKQIKGYELEKARPNTSEDFFNRSEVTFEDKGEEKTFHLLYVRYFDEQFTEFTPYESDPIFSVQNQDIYFKDIVGIVALLKNPDYRNRKRVYINSKEEFEELFQGVEYEKLSQLVESVFQGGYDLAADSQFVQ